MVFTNASLMEMATVMPQTVEELETVNGVGKAKSNKFGEQFLSTIRAFTAKHGLRKTPSMVVVNNNSSNNVNKIPPLPVVNTNNVNTNNNNNNNNNSNASSTLSSSFFSKR